MHNLLVNTLRAQLHAQLHSKPDLPINLKIIAGRQMHWALWKWLSSDMKRAVTVWQNHVPKNAAQQFMDFLTIP